MVFGKYTQEQSNKHFWLLYSIWSLPSVVTHPLSEQEPMVIRTVVAFPSFDTEQQLGFSPLDPLFLLVEKVNVLRWHHFLRE